MFVVGVKVYIQSIKHIAVNSVSTSFKMLVWRSGSAADCKSVGP